MTSLARSSLAGALAGAAGTTALNAVTYLDMAIRGRPSSSTPQESVEKMAKAVGLGIPGNADTRQNRLDGLGPLLGLAVGVGIGVAAAAIAEQVPAARRLPLPVKALLVGVGAMAGTDSPMTALGISDPREWPVSSWAADLVPHLAYGAVTALALEELTTSPPLR
jgi:hypothetical protein